ncbi:MAG: transglutaminase family protein [Actinomycetota bacterium]
MTDGPDGEGGAPMAEGEAAAVRLHIRHRTSYRYDQPVPYGLQQLRLTPSSGVGQTVVSWDLSIEGGHHQLDFQDHHGNRVTTIGIDSAATTIEVLSEGVVDTTDTGGVLGDHRGYTPLWLFERTTELTEPGDRVVALTDGLDAHADSEIGRLHGLSQRIAEAIEYQPGRTDSSFTAEEALAEGSGVCQDHAHVFIAAARHLGFPGRYISGYLLMEDTVEQAATHAWAEVWVAHLGWVGFDISNGISPDERYVRLATGLDYREAAPISGLRFGGGEEAMEVSLAVQAQQ